MAKQNFLQQEEKAKIILIDISSSFGVVVEQGHNSFQQNLEKSNLKEDEKKKAANLFLDLWQKPVQTIASKLFRDLEKGEGLLYNLILSDTIINILESIQTFKAKLDEILPVSTDKIIAFAAPAIAGVVGAIAPGIAVVMQTYGIVNKVANFLEKDNLNTTIEKMREDLAKVKEDKRLDFVNKAIDLINETGLSGQTLASMGFDVKMLKSVVKEVQEKPEVKDFLIDVGAFANKILPENEKDIDKKLEAIKKTMLETLEIEKLPKELQTGVIKQIDKDFAEAKKQMKPSMETNIGFFDKVKAQNKTADILLKCSKEVGKLVAATSQEVAKKLDTKVEKQVQENIKGDLSKIAEKMKSPKVKAFAKEALKVGHADMILLERGNKVEMKRGR